jgi:hypothetical protein
MGETMRGLVLALFRSGSLFGMRADTGRAHVATATAKTTTTKV